MARKKEQPKALFAVKHDFAASLDNLCHEAIMLLQAVDMVIRNGNLNEPTKEILTERSKAFRAALSEENPE